MGNVLKFSDDEALAAKPGNKPYKIACGAGIYLMIFPTGVKSWRWDYKFNGKRGTITISKFPDVKLSTAYLAKKVYEAQLQNGRDPRLLKNLPKLLTCHSLVTTAATWVRDKVTGQITDYDQFARVLYLMAIRMGLLDESDMPGQVIRHGNSDKEKMDRIEAMLLELRRGRDTI